VGEAAASLGFLGDGCLVLPCPHDVNKHDPSPWGPPTTEYIRCHVGQRNIHYFMAPMALECSDASPPGQYSLLDFRILLRGGSSTFHQSDPLDIPNRTKALVHQFLGKKSGLSEDCPTRVFSFHYSICKSITHRSARCRKALGAAELASCTSLWFLKSQKIAQADSTRIHHSSKE
jgi:hypothetical protein